MKIAFAALTQGYYRNIESVVERLAEGGHDIYLGHEKPDSAIGGQAIIERLAGRFPNIRHGRIPEREPEFSFLASKLRLGIDYLRYLHPMYTKASWLRTRAEVRTPLGVVRLMRAPLVASRVSRWLVGRYLDAIDRAIPPSPAIERFLDEQKPDLLVVTPLMALGGASQLDVLRSAQARGIPTVLIVWSWDHLSSKAVIRDETDGVFVWNDAQRDVAIRMHGLPASRVVVTGAQCFDKWFGRSPARTRPDFLRRVGLPADRPYILWVCSALLQGGPREPRLVMEWATHLRNSADPRLRDVPILIRPHPSRLDEWEGVDWRSIGHVALFGDNPIEEEARDDYFDTLYHSAAVVGITTSAFIEAAIVDRPVMTIFLDDVRHEHEGSLHFQLLLNFSGGLMTTASTLEEHARQLASMIESPPREVVERQRRFVRAFVRPHGLDVPATDVAVEKLEEIGRAPSRVAPRRSTAIGRSGLRALAALERDPRWHRWFLAEREAARDAWIVEKRRLRDRVLGRTSREEKDKRRDEKERLRKSALPKSGRGLRSPRPPSPCPAPTPIRAASGNCVRRQRCSASGVP